jgi:hypothetical protein
MRDWVAAGVAGAVLSGAPSGVHALVRGANLLDSTAAIASAVLPDALPRPVQVVVGAAAHVGMSLGWAAAMRRVLGPEPAAGAGAVAGLAIAALDLGVIGRRLPPIRRLPAVPQILDHVAYGVVVAVTLRTIRGIGRPDAGTA